MMIIIILIFLVEMTMMMKAAVEITSHNENLTTEDITQIQVITMN